MASVRRPHLYQNLRLALSVLYSLPSVASTDPSSRPNSAQAHEYLLQFQQKNVRRKLISHAQKEQSRPGSTEAQNPLDHSDLGSSWLACLALLCSLINTSDGNEPQANYAEALFAAQTLVHRLRYVKLSEAIDLEIEPPLLAVPANPQALLESYLKWMESFDATVYQVVKNYQPHSEDEDCIKGELTLLTLTTILYRLSLACHNEISSIRPLLATISSADGSLFMARAIDSFVAS